MMKKLLILLLLLATIAFGQISISQDQVRSWMISRFQVPADAKISDFIAIGNPVQEASIVWTTGEGLNYQVHMRKFDFMTGKIIAQSD